MATINMALDLQLTTCPYNPSHRVKSSRFQKHLTQCAKQYAVRGVTLRECPFNCDHRIPEDGFAAHVMSCADNRHFVRSAVDNQTLKLPKPEVKRDFYGSQFTSEDIWSEEYRDLTDGHNFTQTYDILEKESISAQELFELRFDPKSKQFTDTLYLHRMTYEERKKYNQLCVDRLRILAKEAEAKALEESKAALDESRPANTTQEVPIDRQTTRIIEVIDGFGNKFLTEEVVTSKKQKIVENVEDLRLPATNPFVNRFKAVKAVGVRSAADVRSRPHGKIGVGRGIGFGLDSYRQ